LIALESLNISGNMKHDIQKITEYMFLESDPHVADIAIIFGTYHKEPIDVFVDLYNKKIVPKVLITGGTNRVTGSNEAEEIAKELKKQGISSEDIILENKSNNSLENVVFSKEIIDNKVGLKNITDIIYITKHYHARRALLTLKKYFPKHITFHPMIYSLFNFDKVNWHESEVGKKRILGEYERIKKYQEKGDIAKD
jgi:uncharacterized SAM-binding protein YcdF (DUF218 family)